MKSNNYFIHIFRFVLLILTQVLILNKIPISGYILPYVYIMFIILLPFEIPHAWVLILGFFTGITLDMFSDTMGMHASACVLLAFVRPSIIRMLIPKDDFDTFPSPTIKELGFSRFLTYVFLLTLIHHVFLFYVEVFHLSRFFATFFRAVLSTLFSVGLIVLIHYLFSSKKEK